MKPKKNKQQRPNIHTKFSLSDEECRVLSDALTFMLNLKDFSLEEEKINYDSADNAETKLFDKVTELTRGEVRATSKAIDVVLLRLPDKADEYAYMEDDFPELLSNLKENLPILQHLQLVFQAVVRDLRKNK